jgi:hypothetical protein
MAQENKYEPPHLVNLRAGETQLAFALCSLGSGDPDECADGINAGKFGWTCHTGTVAKPGCDHGMSPTIDCCFGDVAPNVCMSGTIPNTG